MPLRRSELLPRGAGQDLAGLGAAPAGARPRSAGRLVSAARGRFQLHQEGKARRRCATTCAASLREAKIGYTGLASKGDSVEVRITKDTELQTALTKLRELSQPLGGLLGSNGQRSLEVSDAGGGMIRLTVPPAAITDRIRQTIEQSIQIVERRVNELGTVEPLIQRQGADRILVQVPGLQDPTRLKELLGKTAKMDFRMVDSTVPPEQAAGRPSAAGFRTAAERRSPDIRLTVVKKQVLVSGGDLTDAQPGFDQRTSEPIVNFRFNTAGARKFAQATAGECRPALRHRARQQGDLGAGDPRADHRRLAARSPATSPCRPPTISRSCCAPARCRRR